MHKRAARLPTPDIDLDDEIVFQHRSWRFQSWGRLAVLLFVFASALGFFGGGLVGDEKLSDPAGQIEVDHPRFARHDTAYHLRVVVQPGLIHDGRVAIWVGHSLLDGLLLEGVLPRPDRVEQGADGVIFHLRADGSRPLTVHGYLRTRGFGGSRGKVGVVGGPSVELQHFIYP